MMKQESNVTKRLAAAQESKIGREAVVYRVYTADKANLNALIERYFQDYTSFRAYGVWQGVTEDGRVIEVIGTSADLQSIVHLAGDIKQVNNQQSVLVTWNNVSVLNV